MFEINLLIDSPAKNSNILYSTNYYCIDPIVVIETKNDKIVSIPSTEFENFKKKGNYSKIYNLSQELKNTTFKSYILFLFLKDNNINVKDIIVYVPEDFPVREADFLIKMGVKLEIKEGSFFQNRVSKNIQEINYIKENSKKNCLVMKEVYEILANSSINNNNVLVYDNQILTSEYLQNYILKRLLDLEMTSDNVIVAIGDQGVFPHEYGSGTIFANTSIIVDIFPRSRRNYYYSDMTRTFCKGKASDQLKKIYNTVYDAQRIAMEKIHAREDGQKIHQFVQTYFENKGFSTGIKDGILQGFFHGTGHGLGLDCHEYPYISNKSSILPENSIVSVEPGLYYLGIGGVRIEDIVLVTENGIENLIDFPKKLEIE